jgi:hypothetical protein
MRTPTKDRLKNTALHGIVQTLDFYGLTVEDITEYKARVPEVKQALLSHRDRAERERKRLEGLEKARQAKRAAAVTTASRFGDVVAKERREEEANNNGRT